jgi:hypothetical protein
MNVDSLDALNAEDIRRDGRRRSCCAGGLRVERDIVGVGRTGGVGKRKRRRAACRVVSSYSQTLRGGETRNRRAGRSVNRDYRFLAKASRS